MEEFLITLGVVVLGVLVVLSVWRLVLLVLIHRRQCETQRRLGEVERHLRLLAAGEVSGVSEAEETAAAGAGAVPVSAAGAGVPRKPALPPPVPSATGPLPGVAGAAIAGAAATAGGVGGPLPPLRPVVAGPALPPVPPSPAVPASAAAPAEGPAPPGPVTESLHRVERAALTMLRKAWNWIVVGEEYRDSGKTVEYAVATTWLVRLGVVLIVVGIGFGLRYSFVKGIIGPGGRVTLGALAGVALIGGGLRLLGRRYHLLGQGLCGGGLATLYVTFFAAYHFDQLFSGWVAFGLMGVVTAAAGVIAVSASSLLIAVLGIIGGYLTPFVLTGSEAGYGSFFGYLLLLGCGILAISHFRQWILLNYLGMGFTYVHVLRTLQLHYRPEHFARVMPFLVSFFVLYSAVTIVYNVVHRRQGTLLEVLGLFLNSGVFFGLGQDLIRRSYDREWVALLTVALTMVYVGLVYAFLLRGLRDRALLLALLALAGFYAATTMPLLLSRQWLTVSWAVQAFLMVWLSRRLDSRFLQALGCVLYGIVVWRLFLLDFAGAFRHAGAPPPLERYLRDLGERVLVFGVPVASFAGAWHLHRRAPRMAGTLSVPREADTGVMVRDSVGMVCFVVLAALAAFVYLHLELNRMFAVVFDPLRLPMLTALWVGLALALLAVRGGIPGGRWLDAMVWVVVAVILLKLLCVDLDGWRFSGGSFRFGGPYSWLEAAMRVLDFGLVVAFAAGVGSMLRREGRFGGRLYAGIALVVAFVYLTIETNTVLHFYVAGLRPGGISILWSLFALGMVVGGVAGGARSLRLCGLLLFAVVGLKVFFVDLAHLTAVYRMVALVAMGIIILLGSFIYLKNAERFLHSGETGDRP
ncbi:MAG: DUF2339 domain-containing protein [Lentisphaeria bacterium]|nr:DUF2339 domain-containing protein [Lentisphaeria bacterium]